MAKSKRPNPGKGAHEAMCKYTLETARLARARAERKPTQKLVMDAMLLAKTAEVHCELARHGAGVREMAETVAKCRKVLTDAARNANPSEAGSAAIGGLAGGLLLGPLGAGVGAYAGTKLKSKSRGKKAAKSRKKNPSSVSSLLSKAMK